MTNPSRQPAGKCERKDALTVLRRLREAGQVAYFAGGCVRDLLLGQEPKDFDVATDAPPARVRELFSNTQAVGAAFGVILVRLGGSQIEVATFRADGTYADGRHPSEVRFTTAEEDARRRDFTINGLFLDPLTDQVIDYVGGQQDLAAKTIRAIGEPSARFEEDSLRLLRAVRFSARFGFAIEGVTAAAIVAHAPQLKRISPERIADELRVMLTPATRAVAWRMLWELELVPVLFRFLKFPRRARPLAGPMLFEKIAPGQSVPIGLALAGAILCYRARIQEGLEDPRLILSRGEISAAVQAMRQALKISNEESEQLRGTLAGIEPLLRDAPPGVAALKRFLAEPTAPLSRQLLEGMAGVGIQVPRIPMLLEQFAELQKTDYAPLPFVDGDLLVERGLRPGPKFKKILDAVYDAQLEGRLVDRQQAIEMALQIAGEKEPD